MVWIQILGTHTCSESDFPFKQHFPAHFEKKKKKNSSLNTYCLFILNSVSTEQNIINCFNLFLPYTGKDFGISMQKWYSLTPAICSPFPAKFLCEAEIPGGCYDNKSVFAFTIFSGTWNPRNLDNLDFPKWKHQKVI